MKNIKHFTPHEFYFPSLSEYIFWLTNILHYAKHLKIGKKKKKSQQFPKNILHQNIVVVFPYKLHTFYTKLCTNSIHTQPKSSAYINLDSQRVDCTTPCIWSVIVCKTINNKWKEKLSLVRIKSRLYVEFDERWWFMKSFQTFVSLCKTTKKNVLNCAQKNGV
jgi:hypothetical protein